MPLDTRRIRDFVTGRREIRLLVEVDPQQGVAAGGSPVAGSDCVEFVVVATGTRSRARRAALDALCARLESDLPDAVVRSVRDVERPRRVRQPIHMLRGPRPAVGLTGFRSGDDADGTWRWVAEQWGIDAVPYRLPPVPDPAQVAANRVAAAVGLAFGAPLFLLLMFRLIPSGPDVTPLLARLGGDPEYLVALLIVAALPGVAWADRLFRLPASTPDSRGLLLAAICAALPSAAVVGIAGFQDGVAAVAKDAPGAALAVVGGLCLIAIPLLWSLIERPVLKGALSWGIPVLAGGIAPFVGEMILDRYLGDFGIQRSDVMVSVWAQWANGMIATIALVFGAYVGVAIWILGRRIGLPKAVGVVFGALIGLVYVLTVVEGALTVTDTRAQIMETGLPGPLFGLAPVRACLIAGEPTYPYVGAAAPSGDEPVVYFGRSDGRLAVWSQRSGGVLIDGQSVSLKYVAQGEKCS